ncbi:hypothetical protein KUTeg_010637 [Tegillarca granosa]|uniref:Uncharacterized protein n=1 Tax=Tegillarca granosa TaxID=220873 RepID=A0ABQ9F337_TEGGR|nr:hypothetical protein KUTeg_010637 [Tegillarca granosa]
MILKNMITNTKIFPFLYLRYINFCCIIDNPVVTVGISPAYIRETDTFERHCTADGNPPPTISWTSNTSPSNASIFKLVTTMRNQTGDYTCRAQAQSKGPHGLLSGQAVLKVIVQFPPTVQAILEQTISAVFNSSKKFYAELDKTVEIRIPFFANPKIQNADKISLTKENINKIDRTDIKLNIETKYFDIVFHGKTIIVDGQQTIIQIFQFKSELQGNYTIGIKNYDQGSVSTFVFQVILSGVSLQSVTITEDTVKCTLNGNCGAINWYLSSSSSPVASALIGYPCRNTTSGYYQTCDNQNHQYTLYFTGTPNLHGQTIRCSGEGCTPQQTVSDTVTISNIVPVSSVALERISGQQITVPAGQSKSITCVTGSSRPASRILWYIGGTNLTSLSTETQVPSQELFYTRDPPDDANAVIKQRNTISTIEGNSTALVCEVRGGNPLATIIWDCFGLTGTSSTDGDISRSTINFIAHRSHNRRTCTCRATHPAVNLGIAAKLTSMNISDGNNFTIPEHSSKTITCFAEGLPQPTITLAYISNSSIIKSVNGLRLDFTFPLARCEDAGIYRCDAINKFTPQQPLQKEVFVLCPPRAAKEPLQNRYALSVGKTLNITPTFKWFKNIPDSSSTLITDGEDVQINNSVINTYTYVTQLIRENMQEDGFGTYILISNNIIGTNKDVYIVGANGTPQKPRNGQALCIDYKAAVITWKPGFFNGDNQTFSVVYKEKGGREQISVSNISDPGHDKYINHTVNFLQGAKTYIFTIYSRNTLGESPPLEVNCTTKVNTNNRPSTTGKAVGAGLGSIIALGILLVIVIYFLRRYQTKAKGKKDNQVNKKEDDKFGVSNETAANNAYENVIDTSTNNLNYEILQTLNGQQPYEQIKMQDTYEEISRTDTRKLNYETLQTLSDQQPYEQINLEEKIAIADAERNVFFLLLKIYLSS